MSTHAGLDAMLDHLVVTTQSLRDSARAFTTEQASELLARRQQLVSSLRSAIRAANLTDQQRGKLQQAVELGNDARQALLIKRETTRSELQEKLAGRRVNESFKPYRPKKLGNLNIKL